MLNSFLRIFTPDKVAVTNRQTKLLKPLIRWAGSKRKSLDHLLAKTPRKFNTYIEPFFGSGCFYFALQPKQAILGDLNPSLIEMYKLLCLAPLKIFNQAREIPSDRETYYKVRDEQYPARTQIQRAAQFLYLNRFCFNAIYRTNKSGKFNVPYGTRTGNFPVREDILSSTRQLKKSQIICADFEETISRAKKGDFVYLDPPYASSDKKDRNEYGNGSFATVDLMRLILSLERLHAKRVHFLLSYSYCDELINIAPKIIKPALVVRRSISASLESRACY